MSESLKETKEIVAAASAVAMAVVKGKSMGEIIGNLIAAQPAITAGITDAKKAAAELKASSLEEKLEFVAGVLALVVEDLKAAKA